MRVVFRAEHKLGAAGVEHTLTGPLAMLDERMVLRDRGERWASCMADMISRCSRGHAEISSAGAMSPGVELGLTPGTDPLYSWIIAAALEA
jgi:hypothetical protein